MYIAFSRAGEVLLLVVPVCDTSYSAIITTTAVLLCQFWGGLTPSSLDLA